MDENKKNKLREIGYTILPSCGICVHGAFRAGQDFGDYQLHAYAHIKHNRLHDLSVHHAGSCECAKVSAEVKQELNSFIEFINEK